MVPDGVEEVELEKVNLEKKEREKKLLLDDIRKLSLWFDLSRDPHPEKEADLWMIDGGITMLVRKEPCYVGKQMVLVYLHIDACSLD